MSYVYIAAECHRGFFKIPNAIDLSWTLRYYLLLIKKSHLSVYCFFMQLFITSFQKSNKNILITEERVIYQCRKVLRYKHGDQFRVQS